MKKSQDVNNDAQSQPNSQLRPQTKSMASSHFGSMYMNPGWAQLQATQGQAQQLAEEYRRTYGDPVENLSSIVTLAPEDLTLLLGDVSATRHSCRVKLTSGRALRLLQ